MTDSSTWVATQRDIKGLNILFRGDPFLINTYRMLCRPDAPKINGTDPAAAVVHFPASPDGQGITGAFGVAAHGEGLYNDAAYAKPYDHLAPLQNSHHTISMVASRNFST